MKRKMKRQIVKLADPSGEHVVHKRPQTPPVHRLAMTLTEQNFWCPSWRDVKRNTNKVKKVYIRLQWNLEWLNLVSKLYCEIGWRTYTKKKSKLKLTYTQLSRKTYASSPDLHVLSKVQSQSILHVPRCQEGCFLV